MVGYYNPVSSITSNRESIRLMVRVVTLWAVPLFNHLNQTSCLEMLLADEHGGRIQAVVKKPLLHRFSGMFEEGSTYKMVYFNVVPNTGGYRASAYEFKLVFLLKTTVQQKECPSIPLYGLNCVPFVEILNLDSADNHQFLSDVMGLLIAVFPQRQYMIDGKITNMVVMELTDPNGKLECALFGDYADMLRSFLQNGDNIQVVVVVQLARVKTFRDFSLSPKNSFNGTRLLFNLDIPEAICFRNSIAQHESLDVEPLTVVMDTSRKGLEADFTRNHPKKTVAELTNIHELLHLFVLYFPQQQITLLYDI